MFMDKRENRLFKAKVIGGAGLGFLTRCSGRVLIKRSKGRYCRDHDCPVHGKRNRLRVEIAQYRNG